MKNFVNSGNVVQVAAPSGGVVSGRGYLIGALPMIAVATADETVQVAMQVTGVCRFTASANFPNLGAVAFLNLSTQAVTPTSATGLVPIGHFVTTGLSGAVAEVRLAGVTAAEVG